MGIANVEALRQSMSANMLPEQGSRSGARLDWTDPTGQKHSLTLGQHLTLGRGTDNDVVLADRMVSRHHATITAAGPGRFTLADLGSSNGTAVNDQRLAAPVELRSGDRIAIGATTLVFTAEMPRFTTTTNRVVPLTLAADGTTMVRLGQTALGWLELPDGKRRKLDSETRIGRSTKNDIVLDDSLVSRNHAHIRRIDDRFVLSDLGSANGVAVNGEPVLTPRTLTDGDTLAMGSTELRFSLEPLPAEESITGDNLQLASETRLFSLASLGGPAAMKGDLRTVTILFSDMHGSTAMAERINNPELTTAIMNQVFEMLTAEIVRYDGWVDKYAGDNIMALFGAPRAHEDDPERAIKAALAMQAALENFNRRLRREIGLRLQMRTGINTGEVLFGQVGGGAFRSYTVMGDPVNLASRLEHASRVGHILVGESTYALGKHAFHFTALPPMDIKGKREPVQTYEVVREKRADEVLREPAGGDALVGREQELQHLGAALEDAIEGQGRLVALVGDVGIGTSQLLAAFQRAHAEAGVGWIVERCLSYNTNAPYALLAGILRSLLGLDTEEAPDRAKLLAALKETLGHVEDETRAEYLALIGQILGVQINNAFIQGLEAKVRRKLTTAMIRALVAARAQRGPLALILEEMQWADSASVDALDELVESLPTLPVLLLLAYRPEWGHNWSGRSFYRQINLPELSQEQSRRLLRQVLRAAELPDAVADAVYDQCGGNPLLLQETVKALQERGVLVQRQGAWALTDDVSVLNIPSTLRGVMMARIDSLEELDRAVLQKAAVIGRSFTYRLLATITGLDDALDDSLAALKDREIIVENPLAAEPEYTFKHTVIQEIAYNNVLAAERRALHERVGEALERINAGHTDDQLEVLAYHYSRSGNKRKAVEYLLRSGEKARRLYANDTAIAQFEEALEKARSLPAAERDPAQLVRIYELLGDVQLLIADFRRAQENYEGGLAVAARASLDTARLWNALGLVWERRGDYRKALGSYEQGVKALRADAPRAERAALQISTARALVHRGDYQRAAELATAALAGIERHYEPDDKRARADALHILGQVAYDAGRPDEALTTHLQSLELRQELGDTMGMQESYHQLGTIYWSRGQLDRAFEHLVSLTQVLRLNMHGLDAPDPDPAEGAATASLAREEAGDAGAGGLGAAPAPAGETAPIERYYRSGLSAAHQVGDLWGVAVSCNRLGGMLARQGERERALYYLRKALAEAERIGAREVAAQAGINLGVIAIAQGDTAAGLQQLQWGLTYAEAVESVETVAEGNLRLAEGRLAAQDLAGAQAAADAGYSVASRVQHRSTLGLAHRVLGRIATARAEWAAADAHFRAALDAFGQLDALQEVGRTLYHFALMWQAWSAAGGGPVPEGATVMLQQAAQIFSRLDMQHDLVAARAALAA